jgi:Transglycosylase SLT domain/Sel1 repeat
VLELCRSMQKGARRWSARMAAAGLLAWCAPLCLAAAGSVVPADIDVLKSLRSQAAQYEHGEGVRKDERRAAALYCRAARLGDAESQFSLGYMHAMGRGVDRNDGWAAYFFSAAAEQGIPQAKRMLQAIGDVALVLPPCMRDDHVAGPAPGSGLVAGSTVPMPSATIEAPKAILELVTTMAPEYRIDPQLVLAIMKVESNFDRVALSPKNAKGLMQLIPETAARFNVKDPYDARQNIRGGLAYLRWLLAYFEGDVSLVAAAYNAGEGAVERYRGVPPFLETRAYVQRVVAVIGPAAHPFDASVARPSPQLKSIQNVAAAR